MHKQLGEIASIKRCRKRKYPKDTLYIYVSATDRQIHITEDDIVLDSRSAVIIPEIEIMPKYLFYALKKYEDYFFSRYVGTNINVSIDSLSFYPIDFETDLVKQNEVVEKFEIIEKSICATLKQIEEAKRMKQWFLEKMLSVINLDHD
jgi:restriction endonuclease S subunit